jgi:hypothetical protein
MGLAFAARVGEQAADIGLFRATSKRPRAKAIGSIGLIQGAEAPCSLRKTNTEILAFDFAQARMTVKTDKT